MCLPASSRLAYAQAPMHDPNLPSVKPEALRTLSDNRIRQDIMRNSQAPYPNRCVCPYQTKDLRGRSCKGRHEIIKTRPRPICYAEDVTDKMVSDWRGRHP
jgi:hypothetical protein